ncbi:MAG: anti-sigma factor family protein [Terriglobales bacterium]
MKNAITTTMMKCNEIRELMPDLAAGISVITPQMDEHMQACPECTVTFGELRQTMALLDEWQAPEPSPYFDSRLRAQLREEMTKEPSGWRASFGRSSWIRKPALAFSLAAILVMGILFRGDGYRYKGSESMVIVPGSAVSDLQALDKNHDLYSNSDLLDDLEVQQNVTANP